MTVKIYKYFSEIEHLNDFVQKGKIKFGNLSYYRNCEYEQSRRDVLESVNLYKPLGGLEISNITQDIKLNLNSFFHAELKDSSNYWIFCTSMSFNKELWTKFNAIGCVEILNFNRFRKLVEKQIPNGYSKLVKRKMTYYDIGNPPETRYADTVANIFSKTIEFLPENEFRFCFSNNQNNFNEVYSHFDYCITDDKNQVLSNKLNIKGDDTILTIGNLSKITVIRYFDV